MSRTVFNVVVAVLAIGCALWLIYAASGVDAYRVLESALTSDWTTDYSGEVRIADHGTLTACYRIRHQAPNRNAIRYLPPQPTDLIIVQGGDGALCLDEGNGAVLHVPGSGLAASAATSDLIRANYRVRILGIESTAGRRVIRIRVTPKSGAAVSREYWIDQERGLVLCSRELDRLGNVVYEERFTWVRYEPVLVDTMGLAAAGMQPDGRAPLAEKMAPADLSRRLGFAVSEPKQVPRGYVLVGTYLTEWRGGREKAALYRYSDGLSSISVFQTRPAGDGDEFSGHGAASLKAGRCVVMRSGRGMMAVVDRGGVRVIAVGDLPAGVLSALAVAVPAADGAATG